MMLGRSKVRFAGYMVGEGGIEVDPGKIEAVNMSIKFQLQQRDKISEALWV